VAFLGLLADDTLRDEQDRSRLAHIASVALAEPIGSLQYFIHTGLLTLAGISTYVLFEDWHFISIVAVYNILLTLEKAVADLAMRQRLAHFHRIVLLLLFLRAVAYNVLVLSVWTVDNDVFKMGAMALLVAATINIFVFHTNFPQIMACVVTPIWLGFVAIATFQYMQTGPSVQSLAAALVVGCLTPYLLSSLIHAGKVWRELDNTRTALSQSQKQDAMGKLVSGVAHDFNNVLAVTLGTAELLKTAQGAEKDRLVDQILRAAEQGAALSGQLLAFNRQSTLEPGEHCLEEIFQEIQQMLERVMPENIAVKVSVHPETPLIYVDRNQLETALLNLAINARDAMPNGGTLELRASRVMLHDNAYFTLSEKLSGEFAVINVRDTGTGVSREEQALVFDPFYTTKPVGKGSGLGLSMVQGFVQQSGGAVAFESQLGRGSNVRLLLPTAKRIRSEVTQPVRTIAPAATQDAKILFVEDEAAIRNVVSRQLQGAGYDVTLAQSGDDAAEKLGEGLRPDLLISDIVMPGRLQGPELAEWMQTHIGSIPVIFVSGYPDDVGALKLGTTTALLRKPVPKDALLAAVEAALQMQIGNTPDAGDQAHGTARKA
jgi:signal transduction histidine kinase/CheY-like chemotaxis protein